MITNRLWLHHYIIIIRFHKTSGVHYNGKKIVIKETHPALKCLWYYMFKCICQIKVFNKYFCAPLSLLVTLYMHIFVSYKKELMNSGGTRCHWKRYIASLWLVIKSKQHFFYKKFQISRKSVIVFCDFILFLNFLVILEVTQLKIC